MSVIFGIDTWCLTALVPGKFARGRQLVVQSIYHRLTTPRGTLHGLDDEGGDEESAYGFDVVDYVGAVGVLVAVHALPSIVRAELKKDDRIAEAFVSASLVTGTNGLLSIALSIDIQLEGEADTFNLALAVTEFSLEIPGVTVAPVVIVPLTPLIFDATFSLEFS